MQTEAVYCRRPFAAAINKIPNARWIKNVNNTVSNGGISAGTYELGLPDGFIFYQGRAICIECKAFWGAAYLGNPEDREDGLGWTFHQRSWWQNVALATNTPYYINLWVHPDREKQDRTFQADAFRFLIPPTVYLDLETQAHELGTRTVGLTEDHIRILANKKLALQNHLMPFAYNVNALEAWLKKELRFAYPPLEPND